MIGTILRRVTVRTLDAVVDKGRSSERGTVRAAASALDRVRGVVGLDVVDPQAPIPSWSGSRPDQPMWDSDRRKLHKHMVDRGIIKEGGDEVQAAPAPAKAAIEVYYKRGCPYSRAAMDLLREREIEFVEHDIKGDDATLSWLKIVTGKQTTPQIFIHGKTIGGFEELRELDQSGQLRQRIAKGPASEDEVEPAGDDALIDEIDVADLRARVDSGEQVHLVDVRTAAELERGMIQGAIHVPLDALDARHGELDADDVWVVYCKSGMRSRTAVQALRSHGFRSAVSLGGGIEAWTAAGGSVVSPKDAKPTKPRRKLPVIHPERSPFEGLGLADGSASSEPLEGDALVAVVREVLDECRPLVQADGGDIELLDVQGNIVHLQLTGNCVGCPSSQATLRQGIERRLKARIPQLEGIASPQLAPG